jgi:hypothetical protein
MTYINNITSDPSQIMTLKLDTGDTVGFNLSYFESQKGWFYGITYGTFVLYNRRIVTGVNMLRGFRNLLPFGFACVTNDGYEPVFKEDFSNGRAKFLLLNATDIDKVETILQQEQTRNG